MIGNGSSNDGDTRYGSGQLLNDLMRYLGLDRPKEERSRRVKLMFVGDMAQLPPVRGSESPALSLEFLQSQYDIRVQRYELTTVVRQTEGGDVLNLAYEARQRISAPEIKPIADSFGGQVYVSNFRQAAIDIVSGINQGKSVMAVVRTNAQVSRYNMTVRRYLWGRHCMNIMQGDTLLVVKNNPLLDLPNGELVQVVGANLKQQRERLVGHNGCEVQLNFRGITIEISNADGGTEFRPILVLENLLYNNRTNLSQAERWALVELVHKRHRYISKESEAFKALLATDPFYNALQVKFGYALTCHKAQGGEWSHVIVDLEGKPLMTQNDWRWFYTAVTRSKEALSLVNLSACNWVEANQRAS
ncbi:UvrD-like helicase C-terminal domain-containing protein [Marinobacterium lutimaris]|uniref:UvrD-like helicase C-terminal domain-containing protein n=2 Tax=Marinobacterium lutimaris TaxID=568106 RepID=A0A1H5VSE1_9GAMM|nr:UvrD-like helicase C-terminal domain-containing protein [Marinobacterium lutimaris]